MKNTTKTGAAAEALNSFDRWFDRDGHWIYRDRAQAFATWTTRGIDGLPAYVKP